MPTIPAIDYLGGRALSFPNNQNNNAQNNDAISYNPPEGPEILERGTPEAKEHAQEIQNLFDQLKKKIQEYSRETELEFAGKDFSQAIPTLRNPNSKCSQLAKQQLKLEKELDLALAKAGVTLDVKLSDHLSPAMWTKRFGEK